MIFWLHLNLLFIAFALLKPKTDEPTSCGRIYATIYSRSKIVNSQPQLQRIPSFLANSAESWAYIQNTHQLLSTHGAWLTAPPGAVANRRNMLFKQRPKCARAHMQTSALDVCVDRCVDCDVTGICTLLSPDTCEQARATQLCVDTFVRREYAAHVRYEMDHQRAIGLLFIMHLLAVNIWWCRWSWSHCQHGTPVSIDRTAPPVGTCAHQHIGCFMSYQQLVQLTAHHWWWCAYRWGKR